MLGPANTDAVNRASRLSYGEATGITQTVRNYAASLGLAVLGTVLVTRMRDEVTSSLIARHVPSGRARAVASHFSESQGSGNGNTVAVPHFVRIDFAYSTQTVLYAMAGVMAAAAVVAFVGLRRGVQQDVTARQEAESAVSPGAAGEQQAVGPPGAADLQD
jgi:hypothetical protein